MTREAMIAALRKLGYTDDLKRVAEEALSEPGMIVVHAAACDVDDDDDGCTCEPLVVAHEVEIASA